MNLEQRIARLEARLQIRELVARYCFAIDARDVDAIGECFTETGAFRSIDGAMNAAGRNVVIEQFHARFAVLGPSNHFTHDQILSFDEDDEARAAGIVNAHAEVVRNGSAMWTSLRYHDEYRFEAGRWRFQVRSLEFFYYLAPGDYAQAMTGILRNRAYAEPHRADYPEGLPTWQRYYRDHPRSGPA